LLGVNVSQRRLHGAHGRAEDDAGTGLSEGLAESLEQQELRHVVDGEVELESIDREPPQRFQNARGQHQPVERGKTSQEGHEADDIGPTPQISSLVQGLAAHYRGGGTARHSRARGSGAQRLPRENAARSVRHGSCFEASMRTDQALSIGMALGFFGLLAAFVGCSGSVQNSDGCEYNGKRHAVGNTFPDSDGCNQCSCSEGGEVQCTLVACIPEPDSGPYCTLGGKRYAPGQQVSDDGCNTCSCLSDGEIVCTQRACPVPDPSCDSLVSEMNATLSSVQKCKSAADCGQPIPRSSCGCTRDLVARKDANLSSYLAQKAKIFELGCASEGGSTCDCPNADGFACIDNVCAWNYVNVEPEPNLCEPYDAAELCVRGKPTADGELIAAGDPLQVTVRSSGCLSSSCSKVVVASCAISSSAAFDVKAEFCVANDIKPGQACTADCGTAHADCSFGQPLVAGEHQVKLGSIAVGFQVPSKLPPGGLCANTR